jgi:uncharacterized Zn-finger protein
LPRSSAWTISKRITRDDIYIADEAFFTGTAAEVTPIRDVDGRIIGKASAARSPRSCKSASSRSSTARRPNTNTGCPTSKIPGEIHARESGQTKPIEVTAKDLPLHCPMPDAPLWARHRASSST